MWETSYLEQECLSHCYKEISSVLLQVLLLTCEDSFDFGLVAQKERQTITCLWLTSN
jgi:hypothetical protein